MFRRIKILLLIMCLLISGTLAPMVLLATEGDNMDTSESTAEAPEDTTDITLAEEPAEDIPIENDSITIEPEIVDDNEMQPAENEGLEAPTPIPEFSARVIVGKDERYRIHDTTQAPYSAIGYIVSVFEKTQITGTGWLYGDNVVATAAHMVYMPEYGGWAKTVTFYPGLNENSRPFGSATAIKLEVPDGWLLNQDTNVENDFAVLTLNSHIGKKAGIINLTSMSDTNALNKPMSVVGYPSEDKQMQLWYGAGKILAPTADIWYYNADTTSGESGSPIFNESKQAIGIHSTGFSDGNVGKYNAGVRFNTKTLKFLNDAKTRAATTAVRYRTHIENVGNESWRYDGEQSGTTGRARRLEAIWLDKTTDEGGNIEYDTHVQNIGWQGWKKNGEMSGTSGRALRLEAIRIRLTGELATKYDIYYRVHCENYGWLNWSKNGQNAGSEGLSLRLEAIQVKMVKKGEKAPGDLNNVKSVYASGFVSGAVYRTHVQNVGWQPYVGNSKMSGTTGRSLRLEAINLKLTSDLNGGITYRTHVQNDGWKGWVQNGALSGTSGRALRLEAIEIKLTGEVAKTHDVLYRTHVQNVGWQAWQKNGAMSGTSGRSLRLEGIEIKIVPK